MTTFWWNLSMAETQATDEGIASVATAKLADLVKGFVFKPRPIVILHHVGLDRTLVFTIRRSLLKHDLLMNDGSRDVTLRSSASAIILMMAALNHVRSYIAQGYVEI